MDYFIPKCIFKLFYPTLVTKSLRAFFCPLLQSHTHLYVVVCCYNEPCQHEMYHIACYLPITPYYLMIEKHETYGITLFEWRKRTQNSMHRKLETNIHFLNLSCNMQFVSFGISRRFGRTALLNQVTR